MAPAQMFFCENNDDVCAGSLSWRYGKSTSNQCIEAWQSQLRKYKSQFWIELFTRIEEENKQNQYDEIDQYFYFNLY